jgi:hypothetical protein
MKVVRVHGSNSWLLCLRGRNWTIKQCCILYVPFLVTLLVFTWATTSKSIIFIPEQAASRQIFNDQDTLTTIQSDIHLKYTSIIDVEKLQIERQSRLKNYCR